MDIFIQRETHRRQSVQKKKKNWLEEEPPKSSVGLLQFPSKSQFQRRSNGHAGNESIPGTVLDNSERLRNPTASNVSARQASTVRRIGWRSSTSVNQTVGEVHRVPAIRDRSSCPNWRGTERGRNNGGSWYGFRIGGLLALPALDDVFEPTFLMTN